MKHTRIYVGNGEYCTSGPNCKRHAAQHRALAAVSSHNPAAYFDAKDEVADKVAKKARKAAYVPYGPRPGRKTIIVGFSGKMGAGKDYLSGRVREALGERGAEIGSSSFAAPLKNEMNEIIARYEEPTEVLAKDFDIPLDQMQKLKDFIKDDYAAKGKELNAYDRTDGVRAALQYLGSDIRRAQNDGHWVEKYHTVLDQDQDFSFATDVRFPNEADSIVRDGGIMIRLEISPEKLRDQAIKRDGFDNLQARNHISETALDGYGRYDLVLRDGYKVEDVIEAVDQMRQQRLQAEQGAAEAEAFANEAANTDDAEIWNIMSGHRRTPSLEEEDALEAY